jgi:hypothetical protein
MANLGAMSDGFVGLYRAMVVDNLDPVYSGRVRVEVPAVLGEGQSGWAMPCVPYLDPELKLVTIPPVGTGVWVTFEGGDPDYPVWIGRFFSPGQGPGPGR